MAGSANLVPLLPHPIMAAPLLVRLVPALPRHARELAGCLGFSRTRAMPARIHEFRGSPLTYTMTPDAGLAGISELARLTCRVFDEQNDTNEDKKDR